MTIHQLLTHSAGLESDYGPTDYEAVSRDEIARRVFAAPLRTTPGKEYFYSNAGYSLLAAIVEILSGQSYEAYLRANLFEPAGMKATGYKVAWRDGQVAHGYVDGKDWGTILDKPWDKDGPYWNLRGNGGLHSTAGDMYRWHLALEGEKILSKSAKDKYFKPHVPEDPEGHSYYAYGWAVFETPRKTRLVAHNGSNGVFVADFRRYVDENVVIYAASNGEMSATALTEVLPAVVFGSEYAIPPAVVAVDATAMDRVVGSYALSSGSRIDVTRRRDAPCQRDGGRHVCAAPLAAASGDRRETECSGHDDGRSSLERRLQANCRSVRRNGASCGRHEERERDVERHAGAVRRLQARRSAWLRADAADGGHRRSTRVRAGLTVHALWLAARTASWNPGHR
ncbi:MAG: beta-lactamase family protein [Blastocatellia bacterium]|nr:beta-lactamase family protein [Blastocatellia bacterium]